jgi:hypothetical protein
MRVSIATDGNRCNSVGQDWDDGFRLEADDRCEIVDACTRPIRDN